MLEALIENTPRAWSERATREHPWEAALWSREGQEARFTKALELLAPVPGETLLDFGCGTGRFHDWLPAGVAYTGVDWSPGMLDRARADHRRAGLRLLAEPPEEMFDLVACIGPFNLPDGWEQWQTWRAVTNLWASCRRALLVSLYQGDDPRCHHYRPEGVVPHAAGLTGRWELHVGYIPNDLMLMLYR